MSSDLDFYGKLYGYTDVQNVLSTRGLCQHISNHGTIFTRDIVQGVITKLCECIPELVGQGVPVKLDGIGIFYPVIANVKGGAETPADFNVALNIKGVRFRFTPDSTDLDDMTTKAFGKKVTFGNGYYQEQTGPKAPKIPLAAAEPAEP